MAYNSNFSILTNQVSQDLRRSLTTWQGGERTAFVNNAMTMIGETLRSSANEGYLELAPEASPDDNLYLLPADYVEMRFVEQVNGNFVQQISPLGIGQAHRLVTRNATALGYLVYSQLETPSTNGQSTNQSGQMVLQLIPANGQNIGVDYWQQPTQFPDSGAGGLTNPVLQAHYQLCLYGTEMYAWQSVQNWGQRDRVKQLFDTEMLRINTAANTARYGAGAARSAPARFYNSAPSRAM